MASILPYRHAHAVQMSLGINLQRSLQPSMQQLSPKALSLCLSFSLPALALLLWPGPSTEGRYPRP